MNSFQTLEINNTTLHISDTGSGDPVLFVHGACGSVSHGEALASRMAGRYRFITYSQRFHLPNPPQTVGVYNADTHAADLIALVETLGIRGCKVIGHSYGCSVMLTAAAMRNDLFGSLYLAEPGLAFLLNENDSYQEIREERADAFRRIKTCFEEGKSADAVATLMRYANGARGFIAFPEKIRWDMVANASSLHRLVYETTLSTLKAEDLKKINVPVRVLLGQHCTPVYKAVTEEIKKYIAHTEVKIIPDAAHDLVYVRPREVAMAIG